jgi:hypothetical protein
MQEDKRHLVGYALFGSALLMLLGAGLVATESFRVAEGSRMLISSILGGVAVVDAALGAYFIFTGGSSG